MYRKETKVVNETGLHARPASDFVVAAKGFQSSITIRKLPDGAAVNAKSIVRLLGEGIAKGTDIEIAAEGEDETTAVDSLVALIQSGFGE